MNYLSGGQQEDITQLPSSQRRHDQYIPYSVDQPHRTSSDYTNSKASPPPTSSEDQGLHLSLLVEHFVEAWLDHVHVCDSVCGGELGNLLAEVCPVLVWVRVARVLGVVVGERRIPTLSAPITEVTALITSRVKRQRFSTDPPYARYAC